MKTTREKPHNRRKTQRINKQTNKPNKNKNKTNKRTSSLGYEKTVSSYQQSVAPGPPNQVYTTLPAAPLRMPKHPAQQQHSWRRTNAGQAAPPAAQSRRPGQAAEGLLDGTLTEDVSRHPGPQEQYRPVQDHQQDQQERDQQDQDEDIQIVDPTQEVRNW